MKNHLCDLLNLKMNYAGLNRRDFFRVTSIGTLSLLVSRLPVMAGPFTHEDFKNLVPADKKLNPDWVKSLFARGTPEIYKGEELKFIGMPVGGIGTGQLYLGGDGKLWHWDIFNQHIHTDADHYEHPMTPTSPLEQDFAIKVGEVRRSLDKFSDIRFRGEYPIGIVNFRDATLPVEIILEAFSPFIPLNIDDSSLPATVMQYTINNTGTQTLDVELTGSLENAVCLYNRHLVGTRHNRIVHDKGLTFLNCSVEKSDQPLMAEKMEELADFGTMGLGIFCRSGTAIFSVSEDRTYGQDAKATLSDKLVSSLGKKLTLDAGQSTTVTFVLTWYFPNLSINGVRDNSRFYATKFSSALAVAKYVAENFEQMTSQTRLWRDTWYDSTLPYWFLDRTFLNTSILATSTGDRFKDGRFYGWEGVGCCAGTCTSVWYYAQAVARLFPILERSAREMQDFADGIGYDPASGGIYTRGEFRGGFVLDGQAGNVLRVYREHQMCSDDAFLKRNWAKTKKALDWLIQQDRNNDGIIDGRQSTTLDMGYLWGAKSWSSLLYLAALRVGEAMAHEMGDEKFAKRTKAISDVGAINLVERLWNGEYFIHKPDSSQPTSFIIGNGCHIDQVYGQAWADQVGLGPILSSKYTKSALRSIWKYNFTPDVGPYRKENKAGRWYAMAGEGGVIMTTWPHGDRKKPKVIENDMQVGLGYLNECMTGFEHQVAGHMLGEYLVMEGLAVERTVHDRYHASLRNPWNEVECGDHYSRAMASYGVYLAACGFEYHGPKSHIGFAPRLTKENFKAAFTAAEGWGSFSQTVQRAEVAMKFGKLRVKTLALTVAQPPAKVRVLVAGGLVSSMHTFATGRLTITLEADVTITAGQQLEIEMS